MRHLRKERDSRADAAGQEVFLSAVFQVTAPERREAPTVTLAAVCPNQEHRGHTIAVARDGELACPWRCETCGGKCGEPPRSVPVTVSRTEIDRQIRERVDERTYEQRYASDYSERFVQILRRADKMYHVIQEADMLEWLGVGCAAEQGETT
jgi:hypothetical protein